MPIALLAIGLVFLIAAVRGKHEDLFGLLKDDFTGPNNFFYWIIAIWAVGAVGYYKPLRPLSVAFLTLIVIVLFLSNKGFFRRFLDQIGSTGRYSMSTSKYEQTPDQIKSIDDLLRSPASTGNWITNATGGFAGPL